MLKDKIAVGGASAGGGLAAALAQLATDRGEIPIALQLLVYPMLDDRTAVRTDVTAQDHAIWNADSNRKAWRYYLGCEPGTPDPPVGAVPARREVLSGLPPAWIGVGTADLFHDESVEYARRLQAAGVDCSLSVVPGGMHGFERLAPRSVLSRRFLSEQLDAVRQAVC